jgi:hypothetical protein
VAGAPAGPGSAAGGRPGAQSVVLVTSFGGPDLLGLSPEVGSVSRSGSRPPMAVD